ncbi:hypothetical protein [Cryobacterium psychrophilum]|uniref:Phage head morphogenesis domain-containing protein n=1 Tax=Cryobacterium psychrophilum TaxID=41988 RepID=A0A4Y8KUB9_9MICO|nr:hypothetical protein [Cryobacterium psychrophilum]TFD80538.1 hypothetical protein E3T53_05550 [Cryobacterium psychrophilum]
MSYQSVIEQLRTSTDRQVMEAYRRYGLGLITEAQFVQLAAAVIAEANNSAVTVADVALSAELTRLSGIAHAPLGILPFSGDQRRLEKGVRTLLDEVAVTGDITERLTRFARTEPLTAANNAYSTAVTGSPSVEGWVRQMDGDPCQLCQWWWRGGRVWPKSHRMAHHKGCSCTQRVVTVDRVKAVAR